MGLDIAVFKSVSTMEREFPEYSFQREPMTGECWVIDPEGMNLDWDAVTARSWRVGNIMHVAALRETIAGHLGDGSALERIVLYSGSHSGDAIEEPSFAELERELKLIESSPDEWVREFADCLSELIGMARREKNPIVFV
ncbi:hypothetical protein FJ987_23030 [Mesorhizobium sp. CU2]|uniref:hypothetical protein n=1 Tax=unclassified Mesorhizobium TaxID=325217 RepID=UPI00112674C7|nr:MULTISPECIES: hypothetical protein [unclassified Mesorhizobium]TPN75951.1 hypothetical protein FJ988_28535 [Mesorhizobium sp. CU3]TPO08877.1 hypothetical protein FJ987_23030 [Mesorhizobium sp. CU2]